MKDYYFEQYAKLIGKKVTGIVVDKSDEEPIYGLKFGKGVVAWILCDPEGNGPGFLDIQED